VAVRDAENRTRFLGYRVERYKVFVWVVSACLAGIAGALYVPQVGIINPSEFAPAASIEAVVWVALGGRGTLVGAIIGAILVNGFKSWFTGFLPELWLFALGGLFIFSTLFLPRGILGFRFFRKVVDNTAPEMTDLASAAAEDGQGDAAGEDAKLERAGA
jgi:urea transport system permease protein